VLDAAALAAAPFLGTEAADTLAGTAGDDVIRGLGGNDKLSGGAGNDVLDGGAGNDILYGGVGGYQAGSGAGNDTYVFGRGYGQDVIYDFDATAGNLDTIVLGDLTQSDVTIRRDQSSLFVSVNGGSDVLRVADWGAGSAYRIERIVFADGSVLDEAALALAPYRGSDGNDNIVGTRDDEVMYGFNGNDTLAGLAGDDLLYGGEGNDTLKGEDGNDALFGDDGNDLLYGGAGNDLLDGGTGTDRMYGGAGDDVYWVDSSADKVFESTNEGIDTVMSSVDYTIADKVNVENITLVGDAVSAVGNNSSNVLRGNERDNSLSGGGGNDLLDGGVGADTMAGGTGNDTYVVDDAGDVVVENANEGIDTVESSVSVTLGDFVENVRLTGTDPVNATGNELANSMIGNSAGNALIGGAGQDTIQGAGGDDLLDGGDGADSLDGGAGVDVLQGGAGDDTLRDADGNSLLDGGAGADDIRADGAASFVAGGRGDDRIAVDAAGTVVAHNRGDGQDTLDLNAERVTLSLGGGTGYQDLALRKSGDNLVLELGSGDAVTLEGWYDESQTQPSKFTLQMLAQAIADFELGGADPLLDQRIETFDFKRLVAEFDADLMRDPTLDRWTPMHKLLDAQLAGYDSEALGGELASFYVMIGSLAGMGLGTAQDALRTPGFGEQVQTIGSVEQPGQKLKLT
jgi:Ca2+-binding RTX toxin-like protein